MLLGLLRGCCGPFQVIESGALEGSEEFCRNSARRLRKVSKRLLEKVGRKVGKVGRRVTKGRKVGFERSAGGRRKKVCSRVMLCLLQRKVRLPTLNEISTSSGGKAVNVPTNFIIRTVLRSLQTNFL
jgi:hypothetical protein